MVGTLTVLPSARVNGAARVEAASNGTRQSALTCTVFTTVRIVWSVK